MKKFVFTSESVSEGHPDKICDQISDAVVDFYLKNTEKPELARVACETMVTTNKVFIAGEVRGDGELENINEKSIDTIAREVIKSIGYEQDTFNWFLSISITHFSLAFLAKELILYAVVILSNLAPIAINKEQP